MKAPIRALGLALIVASACLLGVPAAVAADPTTPSVLVVIDELAPLIPEDGDTLTVRGRVISTARTELTGVSVVLRRSAEPLASRKDVTDVAASTMTPDTGDPDAIAIDSTRQVVSEVLPPGGRASFSIRIPFADLGLTRDGTYVLGVEAEGREAGVDVQDVRKGVLRTFVPWYPTAGSVRPVDLVWLWPLADWPARSASGVLLDNRTPTELSEGGRLDRLVNLGNRYRTTVSWIADPALLETASDMTLGYQVVVDGEVVIGDREQDARRWLTTLGAATDGGALRTVPYGDIDATAVVRAGMSNDVVRAVTTGPGVAAASLGAIAPGGLYWAPFGRIDRSSANVLASAGVTSIVLSADAMPPTDSATAVSGEATTSLPTSFGALRAVLTDPGLTAVLSLPQRSASDVVTARQRFLAETALVATTLPADQTERTLVVAPDGMRWDPSASLIAPLLRATRSAPWLSSTTLDAVLAEPASTTSRERGGYGQKARDAELSPAYMAQIARTADRLGSFTSIIDDPTGISEPYAAALLRAESAAWRTDTARGRELVDDIDRELADDIALVRVLSEGTITFSGDSGRVPVTIANDLDRAVTVGLTLRGRPPLRLESAPLTSIRIDAGRMASVDIDARVVGGDPLTVEVQLLDGQQESYGKPALITVSSTAYARAAAWVVAVAFIAILVFVVFGVTRRIRKAQAARPRGDLGP